MNNLILFGASNMGKAAYYLLKSRYNQVLFCDNDPGKWGKSIEGIKVIQPSMLKEMDNVDIVITSSYYKEIVKQLSLMGINDFTVFDYVLKDNSAVSTENKYLQQVSSGIKLLNLGAFLCNEPTGMVIKEMTFLAGGSGLLDYLFLKALMIRLGFKTYLEIGTWMGESIAAVSEVAEKCYSISMPDDDKEIIDYFRNVLGKSNFSRYFSRGRKNIVHYCGDSKTFDYGNIKENVDLVFIDGDHSYEGVRRDTENIFSFIDVDNSIVVWHDFKDIRNKYAEPVVRAVFDALPENMHKSMYAVDANLCGVYIPEKHLRHFDFTVRADVLYSYAVEAKPRECVLK